MTLLDARGNIIISAETKAAQKALEDTAKSTDNLSKKLKEAEARSKALTKATNKMGNALLIGAAAGAALLGNSIRLAARTQTLGVVVNKLGENAGYTAKEMDALTQGVVDQGITLRHSRTAIAMMAQANIDLAKSSDLARLAQDAAVIANLNSSETFQRLIQVVQTGNIRMARHLGLVVDFQRAYMTFAKANNTTTDALTQQEKAQIRVTEVMRAGQAITGTYTAAMDTAGKKVLSLERHLEESSRIIGELFLPAFADAVDGITKFLESIQGMDEGQRASLSTAIAMTTGFLALGGAILKLRGPFIALKGWLTQVTIGTAAATAGISLIVAAMAAMVIAAAAHEASIKANVIAIDELVDAAIKEGATLDEIRWLIEREAEARGESVTSLAERRQAIEEGGYANSEYAAGIEDIFAAEYEAIKAAKEFEAVAEKRAAIMKLAQEGMLAVTGEAISLAEAQKNVGDEANDMSAKTQGALESMVTAWAENITFMAAYGEEAEAAFEAIKLAVEEDAISSEAGRLYSAELLLGLDKNMAEAAGREWDFTKASEAIAEQMNLPLENFISHLNAIDGRHTESFHTTVERTISYIDWVQQQSKSSWICFVAGTPITMADGSEKFIEEISMEDEVISFVPGGQITSGKVIWVMPPKKVDEILRLTFAGQLVLEVTEEHPFWTTRGWVKAGELVQLDIVSLRDEEELRPLPLLQIEHLVEEVIVFNFHVGLHETYFANGVLVHNKLAKGGRLKQGWNLVGEEGQELIYNGMVFTAAETSKLMASGASGDADGLAGGGYISEAGRGAVPSTTSYISGIQQAEAGRFAAAGTSTGAGLPRDGGGDVVIPSTDDGIREASSAAVEAVAEEISRLGTALPTAQDIASGIQEATLAQTQAALRATQEQIALLEDLVVLTAEAGTSDDIGRSVRDNLASGIL